MHREELLMIMILYQKNILPVRLLQIYDFGTPSHDQIINEFISFNDENFIKSTNNNET